MKTPENHTTGLRRSPNPTMACSGRGDSILFMLHPANVACVGSRRAAEAKCSIASFDVTVLRHTLQTILVLSLACSVSFGQQDFSSSLLEAARGGDARAQNELATAYSEGLGVKPSQRAAIHWFRKSADQGYPLGACNFGIHYGGGAGIRRDRTLMMKWVFIANSLDGLKCQPADPVELFKPTECQVEKGWEMAVAWLKAHPALKNDHGQRSWIEHGEYPVTIREHGSSVQLPIKGKKKCK